MRRFRHLLGSALLLLFALMAWAGKVEATDGLRGDECVVAAGEVILEDFYFFCNTLVIDGFIDGDIVGIASEVTIGREGQVTGDLWVLGGQTTIEGIVGDDVHFLGADLDVTGLARFPNPHTDVVAAGISMEISSRTVVPGDVIYYGYQAIVAGHVNGDVDFQGQSLVIENNIAGNVTASVGDQESGAPLSSLPLVYSVDFRQPGLYFSDVDSEEEGYINGTLTYRGSQSINTRNRVGGRVNFTQALSQPDITVANQSDTFLQIVGQYLLTAARDVIALGLVGILTLNFYGKIILEPGYRVQTRPISAFAWGLTLTFLSLPAALLLLLTSLIILGVIVIITLSELTVMAGIMLLVLNLGVMGGFFFLLAFLGRVVTSFVIGFLVLRYVQRFWRRYENPPPVVLSELWFAILIGVTLLSLVVHLPLGAFVANIQFFLTGIVASAGLGAMFMYYRDLWYQSDRRILSPRSSTWRVVPPPPPDDDDAQQEVPLGMSNLPPGFGGFDD
jgi:hypothetical protein